MVMKSVLYIHFIRGRTPSQFGRFFSYTMDNLTRGPLVNLGIHVGTNCPEPLVNLSQTPSQFD